MSKALESRSDREPLVSVVMATHDELAFLPQAVESVLEQTLGDFEFIIIDDGSIDGSAAYLRTLGDARVKLLRNPDNWGLTRSLNIGLSHARGQFIARMDADDVCDPRRLAAQVGFLSENPSIGVVGSSRLIIGPTGDVQRLAQAAPTDLQIRWKCLLGNPFAHPSVMIRRSAVLNSQLRYDESFRTAQDYELWTRLLPLTRAANLIEPLIRYRTHGRSVSHARRGEQLASHDRIAQLAIRRLLPGFDLWPQDVRELRGRYGGHSVREPGMDPRDPVWLATYLQLLQAFAAEHAAAPGIERFHHEQSVVIRRLAA